MPTTLPHPRAKRRPPAKRKHSFSKKRTAARELEAFVTLLRRCKRAASGLSTEQKQRLRAIMAKAHRAIDRLV